jgi:hypothetical protein
MTDNTAKIYEARDKIASNSYTLHHTPSLEGLTPHANSAADALRLSLIHI